MTALAAARRKSEKVNKYKESLSSLAGIFYFWYDVKDETLAYHFKSIFRMPALFLALYEQADRQAKRADAFNHEWH
jgi:hypothetical protein